MLSLRLLRGLAHAPFVLGNAGLEHEPRCQLVDECLRAGHDEVRAFVAVVANQIRYGPQRLRVVPERLRRTQRSSEDAALSRMTIAC